MIFLFDDGWEALIPLATSRTTKSPEQTNWRTSDAGRTLDVT
ncbi:hypothetical protein PAMC26577_21940 [Caballeronia sordidicola]|uniref:Uncharacterized protein n=1 Tax=Caballeronia sordidicola TaxID=196367 RepID=A0A242MM88_CABSO|nr:hypothetical protein PAMC26577_21940 [Caballeronia sordidicola]